MAKIIAFAGSKGGTGKSSLSHLLGHGAGSLGRPIRSVVLTTDPDEKPLVGTRRRYAVIDARESPERLAAELERLMRVERLLVIVDGAARRAGLDALLAQVADLVVVPFGPVPQDAQRAVEALATMPRAVALPNRWPSHAGVAKRARRWLRMVPEDRCMAPFRTVPKIDGLLDADSYLDVTYDLAQPGRNLLLEILARAGVDPDDLTFRKEQEPAAA